MKNKVIIFIYMAICNIANAQISYPLIIENENRILNQDDKDFEFTNSIISPSEEINTVNISNEANVSYFSGYDITLKPGFEAKNFNNGSFKASIVNSSISVFFIQNQYTSILNNHITIPKWEEFEIAFNLPPDYESAVNNFFDHYYDGIAGNQNPNNELNPYADDSLNVQIDLTSPNGDHTTKWAFFMRQAKWAPLDTNVLVIDSKSLREDYLNPLNNFKWHFRFAPDVVDELTPWTFTINISSNLPGFPSQSFAGYSFLCVTPLNDNHGRIQVNANNNRYLKFEDGNPFFLIGHNLANQEHDHILNGGSAPNVAFTHYFKFDHINFLNAIEETHDFGGNFLRLWFMPRSFQIEFYNLGVYDYYEHLINWCNPSTYNEKGNSQYSLFAFDEIVSKCREENVYFSLTPDQIAPGGNWENWWWGDQAYLNAFCNYQSAITSNFDVYKYFCDPTNLNINDPNTALYYWKRKYKYLISRYGYSVNFAILESFNEIDLTLTYYDKDLSTTGTICPNHRHNWPADPNMKLAIEKWHDVIFRYLKEPTSLGGLGMNNLLTTVSYTENATWNPTYINNIKDYYSLYDDDNPNFSLPNFTHCDITDLHCYSGWYYGTGDAGQNCNKIKHDIINGDLNSSTSQIENMFELFNKPFHFGEAGNWGIIETSPNSNDDKYTFNFYNNYDIGLHNEIWSSLMSGSFSTTQTWFSTIMHRWVGSNPRVQLTEYINTLYPGGGYSAYDPRNSGDNFVLTDLNNNILFSDEIKKLVFEYNRPNVFSSMINFNESYIYENSYNLVDNFESYVMKNSNKFNAYGWIHNVNSFWYRSYYYKDKFGMLSSYIPYQFNCISSFGLNGVTIDGLFPNTLYEIQYFYTRMGIIPTGFPNSLSLATNSSGQLYFDNFLQYLGCDTSNADIAFTISMHPPFANVNGRLRDQNVIAENLGWDLWIIQNPIEETLKLEIKGSEVKYKLNIYNNLGQMIMTKDVSSGLFSFDFSKFDNGLYFAVLTNQGLNITKKLIKL